MIPTPSAAARDAEFWSSIGEKALLVGAGLLVFAAVVGVILFLADRAPKRGRDVIQLFLFIGPALVLLGVGLVYPAIRTSVLAFSNGRSGDRFEWVGIENFVWMFSEPSIFQVLVNTIIWVIVVPLVSTVVGLAYAVFIDKSRGERFLKAVVFMPMAISFVGAGVIWTFVYQYKAEGIEQTGILNQILVSLGQEPQQFLLDPPANTFYLIVVMIWIQTGFAMVLLSAAIKGIPAEIIEASRLDGANAWQQFRNVTLPGIRGTVIVVVTTITIATLKIFDIVRAMTGGNYDTSVIANEMYTQAFNQGEFGRGAALALVLALLVMPLVIYNVRLRRRQEEGR